MSESVGHEEACLHDDLLSCSHFVEWLKAAARRWTRERGASQASLAAALMMPAPMLSNVLAGVRRLPPKHVDMVAETFGADADEEKIIRKFYAFTYARADERSVLEHQWVGARKLLAARNNPKVYMEHWSYHAVREMASLVDCPDLDDVDAVHARLRFAVSREQVAVALDHLRTGRFKPGVTYAEPHRHAGIAGDELHRQGADLLRSAVDLPKSQRHLSAYTDAVSVETFRRVQVEVEEFFNRVVAICQSATGEPKLHVMRVSAALFPLTKAADAEPLFPENKKRAPG